MPIFSKREGLVTITIEVQGSAEYPYRVEFVKGKKGLTAFCDCPAGQFKTYCKHRVSILNGEFSKLKILDKEEAQEYLDMIVNEWLPNTEIEKLLGRCNDLDKEVKLLNRELSATKRELAILMHGA